MKHRIFIPGYIINRMLLAAIVLLLLAAVTAHAAPVGESFLRDVGSPQELAKRIDDAVKKDSAGASLIDPKLCHKKHQKSCAKPRDYLEMFQQADPSANLTEVKQVSEYLRKLEIAPAPTGEYTISCLIPSGKKDMYKPKLACLHRYFKKGEKAWVDKKSGRVVLASDCTNPVEKPFVPVPVMPVALPVPKPTAPACYIIPLDYRQTPGVVWDAVHAARIEMRFYDLSTAQLEQLSRDPCFAVIDATGRHTPFYRCNVCESTGGQWPPPELAGAVGLQKEPKGAFTAPVANGVGEVSLPHWVLVYIGVYCVDVEPYAVSIAGYERWQAVSRFDIVSTSEMHRTFSAGKLDRTLSGERHY